MKSIKDNKLKKPENDSAFGEIFNLDCEPETLFDFLQFSTPEVLSKEDSESFLETYPGFLL